MKKKGGLIAMIVVVLIVALLFGAYQWFRFPAAFRNLSDESLSAEQVNERKEELKVKEDKKVLVTYFSYSGTTRGVAETLSSQIGADLFEIAPKEDYTSLYLQSNMEIRRGEKPELSSEVENMEKYDIVFVGYPVWLAYHKLIQCTYQLEWVHCKFTYKIHFCDPALGRGFFHEKKADSYWNPQNHLHCSHKVKKDFLLFFGEGTPSGEQDTIFPEKDIYTHSIVDRWESYSVGGFDYGRTFI